MRMQHINRRQQPTMRTDVRLTYAPVQKCLWMLLLCLKKRSACRSKHVCARRTGSTVTRTAAVAAQVTILCVIIALSCKYLFWQTVACSGILLEGDRIVCAIGNPGAECD